MDDTFNKIILRRSEKYYANHEYALAYAHYSDYFLKVFNYNNIPYEQTELDLSKEISHYSIAFYNYLLSENSVDNCDINEYESIKNYLDRIQKKQQNEFIDQTNAKLNEIDEIIKKKSQPKNDEQIKPRPTQRPKDAPREYTYKGYVYTFAWRLSNSLHYVCKCGSNRHQGKSKCSASINLPYPFPTTDIEDLQVTIINNIHTCNEKARLNKFINDAQLRTYIEEIYLSQTPRPTRYQMISLLNEKIRKETPEGEEKQSISESFVNSIYTSLEKKHKCIDNDFSNMLKTKRGTKFESFKYRFSSEKSPGLGDLIICYSSDFMKQRINESRYIFIDGTFDTAPQGFQQVLVIIGQTLNMNVPLSYILLPNKLQDTYERAFSLFLTESKSSFFPGTTFITDFEMAEFNAVKKCFMNSSHHLQLCYFHYCQNMIRHFQNYEIKDDKMFNQLLSIAKLLPFINEKLVNEVIDTFFEFQETKRFAVYFQRQYLDIYDFDDWNVSNKPSKDTITNNVAESHNNLLKRVIGSNPSLQQFEIKIQEIENDYFNKYENRRKTTYEVKRIDENEFKIKYKQFITYLKRGDVKSKKLDDISDDEIESAFFDEKTSSDDEEVKKQVKKINPDDADVEKINPDEAKVEKINPDDDKVEKINPDDAKVEKINPDDAKVEKINPDDDKVEKINPDDAKVEKQNQDLNQAEKLCSNNDKDKKRISFKNLPDSTMQTLFEGSKEFNFAEKRSPERKRILETAFQKIKIDVPNIDISHIRSFFNNNKNKM